jgi:hypothetical protein
MLENNGYGDVIRGLNVAHAAELESRVSNVGVRATMAEYQHLLPKLTVHQHWIENPSAGLEAGGRALSHADIEAMFSATKMLDAKVEGTIALADGLLRDESQRRVLITPYHKVVKEALVKALAKYCELGWTITSFDGETPDRDGLVARALTHPRSILVPTQGSIARGFNNLVEYKRVIVAEPDYVPSKLVQLLGRFPRLNASPEPVIAWFVLMEKSIDEGIWAVMSRRLADQNKVMPGAGAASPLSESTAEEEKSWREDLSAMMSGWTKVDNKVEFLSDALLMDDDEE